MSFRPGLACDVLCVYKWMYDPGLELMLPGCGAIPMLAAGGVSLAAVWRSEPQPVCHQWKTVVSTQCGVVSIRGITVFLPGLLDCICMGGFLTRELNLIVPDLNVVPGGQLLQCSGSMGPSQSMIRGEACGFNTVLGVTGTEDHYFSRRVLGVAYVRKDTYYLLYPDVKIIVARWHPELQPVSNQWMAMGFTYRAERDGPERHFFSPRVMGVVYTWKDF